jgi:hypothetical protein
MIYWLSAGYCNRKLDLGEISVRLDLRKSRPGPIFSLQFMSGIRELREHANDEYAP